MYRLLIFLFIILCTQSFARDFELLANKINTVGSVTIAEGNVVVQGANYYVQADKAIYDKDKSIIELFGNVNTVRDANMYTVSNYAKIDMINDCSTASPLFLLNDDNGIWFNAKNSQSDKNIYKIYNSTVSSCDTQRPMWSISFKEGQFDKDKEWLDVYHPTFYIGDIPIGYLPYFGFPTSDKRQSGLLIPQFSLSGSEGLGYIQPVYFAPKDNWDIEVSPQTRTRRGNGLYSTLRFMGNRSKGKLTTGYFKNTSNWVEKYDLEHSKVKGLEFEYEKYNPFAIKPKHEDGLYMDINHYNDVDYLNLKDFDSRSTDAVANSRINYFYQTEDYYFGNYLIHQTDTTKSSNDDTIQTLPSLQLHKFNNSTFSDNLLYSIDYKVKNYTRQKELNAVEQQVFIPISYYKNTLNDYVTLQISENFFASDINYHNFQNTYYEDANLFRQYHKLALSTNLTKGYDSFVHNFDLEVAYTIPSYGVENGDIYQITNNSDELDFVSYNLLRENVGLNFGQYFYTNEGSPILRHYTQQLMYLEGYTYKYEDMMNDIAYYLTDYLTLENQSKFSHEYNKFSYSSTGLWLEAKDDYTFGLSHTMKDTKVKNSDYVILSGDKKLDYKYNIFSKIEYDLEKEFYKKYELGLGMTKSCWGYRVKLVKDIVPINTTSDKNDSMKENKILFEVRFIPMGGFKTSISSSSNND